MRVLQLIYLMLPVYAANMAAALARYWPGGTLPVSVRWLGAHKTWNGYLLAVASAILVAGAQAGLGWDGGLARYDDWPAMGLACGAAAMAGDSLKSLAKRRFGIAPGRPWIPFDQLDFVIAGLIALAPWVAFRWTDIAWVLGLSFAGDLIVNRLAYRLRIKSTPW